MGLNEEEVIFVDDATSNVDFETRELSKNIIIDNCTYKYVGWDKNRNNFEGNLLNDETKELLLTPEHIEQYDFAYWNKPVGGQKRFRKCSPLFSKIGGNWDEFVKTSKFKNCPIPTKKFEDFGNKTDLTKPKLPPPSGKPSASGKFSPRQRPSAHPGVQTRPTGRTVSVPGNGQHRRGMPPGMKRPSDNSSV